MTDKEKRLLELLKTAQKNYSEEYFATMIPFLFSNKFIGYCGIYEDLKYCKNYVKALKENHNTTISSALTISLIAMYGRFFTDATKSKFPKLETSIFNENKDLLKLHEYLMDLRHTFVAHRGESESEIGIALMLIPKNGDVDQSIMKFSQVKRANFSKKQIDKINDLLTFLMEAIDKKVKKSASKMRDALLDNLTPEQISFMVINGMKDK